jgi:hypothetical protein
MIRLTNNSTLDPDTVAQVAWVQDVSAYIILFKDGTKKTVRVIQLTPEGKAYLDERVKVV